ncbi:glutathione S-transferase [Idiomarina sp. OT37-5b]|jgi:glutathione S-transferase|uniref:Glutathione S-transferase n=1 Tax=Idiomarina aquatica TaxID=1327752 RepID=A0AA94EH03_9GAMM|nr:MULTISPECIES: glutathione S-transferase family protein [Idiomarina]AVJ57200.1 glutathione S-transferase [Idiomarina sp. OT37-5b]RUO45697.1 glutathione S-transferase [Idiomarina aquatica]
MELFGSYTSPYVRHIRIALAETKTEFSFTETDHDMSAKLNPAKKVPFLHHKELRFHDSSSILKYVREKAGERYFADVKDYDQYCLVNTALDASINLFLLEQQGVTPDNNAYMQRQQSRVDDILALMESKEHAVAYEGPHPFSDGELRLGCYLSWAAFRNRLVLSEYPQLQEFVDKLNDYPLFADTHPEIKPTVIE